MNRWITVVVGVAIAGALLFYLVNSGWFFVPNNTRPQSLNIKELLAHVPYETKIVWGYSSDIEQLIKLTGLYTKEVEYEFNNNLYLYGKSGKKVKYSISYYIKADNALFGINFGHIYVPEKASDVNELIWRLREILYKGYREILEGYVSAASGGEVNIVEEEKIIDGRDACVIRGFVGGKEMISIYIVPYDRYVVVSSNTSYVTPDKTILHVPWLKPSVDELFNQPPLYFFIDGFDKIAFAVYDTAEENRYRLKLLVCTAEADLDALASQLKEEGVKYSIRTINSLCNLIDAIVSPEKISEWFKPQILP